MDTPFYQRLTEDLRGLREQGLYKTERQLASPQGAEIRTQDGKPVLNLCANNYLGLAAHPSVREAAHRAIDRYGYGMASVRFICGTHQVHRELEHTLSSFLGMEDTILYSSCFDANGGLFETILGETDAVISDALNHASIIDGIRLAQKMFGVQLTRFDTHSLAALKEQLSTDSNPLKIIITDAVFSMDGHIAPLTELLDLAIQFDALLMVDDAHGFGVLGDSGHGILSTLNLCSERWVYVGTLGKAAGVSGAFVCAEKSLTQWISQKARAHIYSTASPPALAHALCASLELIEGERGKQKRHHLNHLIALFKEHAIFKHFKLLPSDTPIQPLILGSNEVALNVSKKLDDLGFMVPAIRPPTVPEDTARLRITLCAEHTDVDVMALVQTLQDIESTLF